MRFKKILILIDFIITNRAHIYDSVRFNLNEISKSAVRKSSQENEPHISNTSPILLKFKEDGLFHELRLDGKNINRISIHNTTPCHNKNVPRDVHKTGKIRKNENQQKNLNFEDLKRFAKD